MFIENYILPKEHEFGENIEEFANLLVGELQEYVFDFLRRKNLEETGYNLWFGNIHIFKGSLMIPYSHNYLRVGFRHPNNIENYHKDSLIGLRKSILSKGLEFRNIEGANINQEEYIRNEIYNMKN